MPHCCPQLQTPDWVPDPGFGRRTFPRTTAPHVAPLLQTRGVPIHLLPTPGGSHPTHLLPQHFGTPRVGWVDTPITFTDTRLDLPVGSAIPHTVFKAPVVSYSSQQLLVPGCGWDS